MNESRLNEILDCFGQCHIAVFGDLFLDRYLEIDPQLEEISIETGKPAHQIVGKRAQPGAAGTVCNNLAALGVGTVTVLSVIGDDGEGHELTQAARSRRIQPRLLVAPDRFTPTYCKPMSLTKGGEIEMERLDTKNRSPLASDLEESLIAELETLAEEANAIILSDQVQERNCGVLTDRVREAIADLARRRSETIFFADSRERIGEFRNVVVKPNRFECAKAIRPAQEGEPDTALALECAKTLMQRTGKPLFLTLDKEGICSITSDGCVILPCPPVEGPIDIVGAGDSVTAGIVSALCSGANFAEAAMVGNLVASITIRQLGTTGTATREQVLAAWQANQSLYNQLLDSWSTS